MNSHTGLLILIGLLCIVLGYCIRGAYVDYVVKRRKRSYVVSYSVQCVDGVTTYSSFGFDVIPYRDEVTYEILRSCAARHFRLFCDKEFELNKLIVKSITEIPS